MNFGYEGDISSNEPTLNNTNQEPKTDLNGDVVNDDINNQAYEYDRLLFRHEGM